MQQVRSGQRAQLLRLPRVIHVNENVRGHLPLHWNHACTVQPRDTGFKIILSVRDSKAVPATADKLIRGFLRQLRGSLGRRRPLHRLVVGEWSRCYARHTELLVAINTFEG